MSAPGRHGPLRRVLEPRVHELRAERGRVAGAAAENNVDTGMGLERMAAILQGVGSVFETDAFRPLVDLAEELSGRSYGDDQATTRAMRIVADHSRGMTFLLADGVVPSNEERGYVLRRVMRRAIQQGRVLGLESPWLARFAERTIEMMSGAYPELARERETILRWVADEETAFGRTLDRGHRTARRAVAEAKDAGHLVDRRRRCLQAPRHLRLPLRPDQGAARRAGPFRGRLGVRGADGEPAAASQDRRRAARADRHRAVISFASTAPPSSFVGYETLRAETAVAAADGWPATARR